MLAHVFANFRGNTAASLICCCFGRCPNLSMNRACRSAFDVAPFCFFLPDFLRIGVAAHMAATVYCDLCARAVFWNPMIPLSHFAAGFGSISLGLV